MRISVIEAARHEPDRPALFCGEQAWSYSQLAERVLEIAAAIESIGLGPEQALALMPRLRPEDVFTIFAAIELGRPLVLLHPRSTAIERANLLERIRSAELLDVEGLANASVRPLSASPADFEPERTLAIFFTSGTSGRPKGARLSHRAFIAAARGSEARLGWTAEDRWYASLPLAHVGGLSIATRCLLARRPIVVPQRSDSSFDAGRLIDEVERQKVTLLSLVPTMLDQILDCDPTWRPARLRVLLLGGAPASSSLLERAERAGLPVATTYGLTEACSQVSTQSPGTKPRHPGAVGRPLPGTEVLIRSGRIHLRGPTLMSGYLGVDQSETFDPEGWFDTGDLGRIDEQGELIVQGRRTDLIVSGGENVYPAEIETALAEHPSIRAACVLGLPDERWGQIVAALVVARGSIDLDELDAWCRMRLASFKRPRRFEIASKLPETSIGKVDRAAVRARFSSAREAG